MRILEATYLREYKIKLVFNNGLKKLVDFEPLLDKKRKLLIPLFDISYFKKFFLDGITICWPNDLDFDPNFLYELGEDIKTDQPKRNYKRRNRLSNHSGHLE
jgi:hypothetical protein